MADPALRLVLEQRATYLGTAFESAERHYGPFGRFLAHGLGVRDRRGGRPAAALPSNVLPPQAV